MKFHYSIVLIYMLLVQPVSASHQVEYRAPTSITTTVGELTTVQLDIKNAGSTAEYYRINMIASLPNEMEITNPNIITKALNPGESVSVFSNIHTLTESPNALTIEIYRDNDLSHSVSATISVSSKKLSLPEFGLMGFLQIIAGATVIYFLVNQTRRK